MADPVEKKSNLENEDATEITLAQNCITTLNSIHRNYMQTDVRLSDTVANFPARVRVRNSASWLRNFQHNNDSFKRF